MGIIDTNDLDFAMPTAIASMTGNDRERMFAQNIGLVYEMAHLYRVKCNEPFEDLVQLAALGMLNAIDKFAPDRGSKFNSYAGLMMRHEICKHLRDKCGDVKIPRPWADLYQKGNKIRRELRLENKDYSDQSIAIALGVDIEKWELVRKAYSHRMAISLNSHINLSKLPINNRDEPVLDNYTDLSDVIPGDTFSPQGLMIKPLSLEGLGEIDKLLIKQFFFEGKTLKDLKPICKQLKVPYKRLKSRLRESVSSI